MIELYFSLFKLALLLIVMGILVKVLFELRSDLKSFKKDRE